MQYIAHMAIQFQGESGCTFELYHSKERGYRVRVEPDCEDWDYDDEADARDMSADLKWCRSIDEAIEVLGV